MFVKADETGCYQLAYETFQKTSHYRPSKGLDLDM